ncbi:hypothetical protein BGV67_04510 [Burkholderia ubonensis]|nr:hypothetical protein BGV67_04510 [Burkholderia ubonensis]
MADLRAGEFGDIAQGVASHIEGVLICRCECCTAQCVDADRASVDDDQQMTRHPLVTKVERIRRLVVPANGHRIV